MVKTWVYGILLVALAACSQLPTPAASGSPTGLPEAGPQSSPLTSTPPVVTVAPTSRPARSSLPDNGPAPELDNQVWLNTEQPLRLAGLRGQVVLLEMWTFGCINCQHVLPALKRWHAQYQAQGLVIIANHFPEFAYERDVENLKQAVARAEILYPVAVDNDGQTWRSYRNQYWPAFYLIDKAGHLRARYIGEGNDAAIEASIQALLAEPSP